MRLTKIEPLNSTNSEPVGTPVDVFTGIIARISPDVGAVDR